MNFNSILGGMPVALHGKDENRYECGTERWQCRWNPQQGYQSESFWPSFQRYTHKFGVYILANCILVSKKEADEFLGKLEDYLNKMTSQSTKIQLIHYNFVYKLIQPTVTYLLESMFYIKHYKYNLLFRYENFLIGLSFLGIMEFEKRSIHKAIKKKESQLVRQVIKKVDIFNDCVNVAIKSLE